MPIVEKYLPKRKNTSERARARELSHESEKTLEARLRREVTKQGGLAVKLLSQLHRGLPDRMVLLPGGRIYFVELKSTGRRPTLLQRSCHEQLRRMGFSIYVVDSTETLEAFLELIR